MTEDHFSSADAEEGLPTVEGIDWNQARRYLPDEKLLRNTVRNFWNVCEDRAAKLQECYESRDIDAYRVAVHSMKSASATIGATALSERARALEDAARGGRWDIVEADTRGFLEQWITYKDRLAVLFADEERGKQPVRDVGIVLDQLDVLRTAMEEFDISLADETMEHLKQYRYEGKAAEIFPLLEKAVINFDPDTVNEKVAELVNYWKDNS